MKKLLLIIAVLASISLTYSQSFELYFEGQPLPPNGEITLTAHPDSGLMVLDTLDVKNISEVTSEVFCVRTIVEDVEGTDNSFCWGSCYPPTIDSSTITVVILPQTTSYEFVGDHYPNGFSGVVKVKYTFFDSHNSDNQAVVFVNYDATNPGGFGETPAAYTISEVYPNPANNLASINYDCSDLKNSSIVVYNMLGTEIEKINVSGKAGKVKINTSLYQEGIYFYSLVIDNEVIRTQKLIVRH